jgi:hypothetical protein
MAKTESRTAAQEDILASLREYQPAPVPTPAGAIEPHYRVLFNQPLPQFNNHYVTAYAASDTEQPDLPLVAAVFKGLPPRSHKAIRTFAEARHPNLFPVVDEGTLAIDNGLERRYAVIYERPAGASMLDILREKQTALPETDLLYNVIAPVAEIIRALQQRGTRHGRIHISNLFLAADGKMRLGEGVTEPPGFSLPFTSDSVEQLLAHPAYKGETNASADCYALGVMALQLLMGAKPLTTLDKPKFLEKLFEQGSYLTLTQDYDFSPQMQDFFRGVFHDNAAERWDASTILRWAGGKRFHILHPPTVIEASRPFPFQGKNYLSRRALAHGISLHWEKARELFENDRLVRWAATCLRKPEIVEGISRVLSRVSSDALRREKIFNESVARLILMLDPAGPVRYRNLAFHFDSLGELLAAAMRENHTEEIQSVLRVIDGDVIATLQDALKDHAPMELGAQIKLLHQARTFLRSPVFGSGMERAMYDLNPQLPCQSPRLIPYSVTGLSDMLLTLDTLARQFAATEDVLDRHGAAFLASRLKMRNDPRVPALLGHSSLSSDPRLVSLYLLITAARKTDIDRLPGLTHWLAVRIAPIFERVHNKKLRESMGKAFIDASKAGNLERFAQLVFDPTFLSRDEQQYLEVEKWYRYLDEQIAHCQNKELHRYRAHQISQWFAQAVSSGACGSVIYWTLKTYLHL